MGTPQAAGAETPRRVADEVQFGAWLLEQLRLRRWSRYEFAKRIDAHPSVVSKWVLNQYRPKPDQCDRIARGLDLDLDTVLAAAGHRPRADAATGVMQTRAVALIGRIPDVLLCEVVVMLQALADERQQAALIGDIRRRISPTGDLTTAASARKTG